MPGEGRFYAGGTIPSTYDSQRHFQLNPSVHLGREAFAPPPVYYRHTGEES